MTPLLAALRWLSRWDPTGWQVAALVAAYAAGGLDEPGSTT